MGGLLHLLSLLCCLTLLLQGAEPATFTITNSCDYAVWPGILSNADSPPPSTTGFALPQGQTLVVTVASAWSGRIWARTLCATDSSGTFSCATADCGSGAVECSGRGAAPPATLAEFTLAGGTGGNDFYDVSLVDGFNVPILVAPQAPSLAAANGSCLPTGCAADLNRACPAELRVAAPPAGGGTVACRSACEAFAEAEYCCSGAYGSPATCAPTPYSRFFKGACPAAYSYAYDDPTSTFTCAAAGGGYGVVFCPSTSSLKSGGNPEAAGLPPSNPTMEFSGDADSLRMSRNAVVFALLQMLFFSAISRPCWW
ncbi:Thaumatin-like protein 1 [Dichanthelium oligosanthes]|uniref:Thaumatin-like protein 1 n=1 Tax=Dichanthelium oligosanthes TaxID=888268 RepID=A0A1E5VLC8_9POAL|nr:Thaumatin-like protein 1 [Dichanthelium oligosanthes]